jgi:hypothetical protein
MTGPLFFTLHSDRRRARLLVPFAAAILVGQLACTSDQATEPTAAIQSQPVVATSGPHPRARLKPASMAATSHAKALLSFRASPSFGVGQAGDGPSVLILADTDAVATSALAASLADSGVQVSVRPAPEYTWDGTNPSLTGFDVVIHLNGATYDYLLSDGAQDALTSFVQNGGGFVGAQWNGYDQQPHMSNLILQGAGFDPAGPEQNCSGCTMTYERLPAGVGHPVLEGLPASFTFPADAHDAGLAADFATPLMQVPSGGPAVLVRQLGTGRVVSFSFAPNYPWNDLGLEHELLTLQDPYVQKLYLNAVRWAAGSGVVVAEPQTINFEPLGGSKAFGDASFTVSATASSGLPVNFTASGTCTVVGSTVSVTAAGACTITAHQAGNDAFAPAQDVSQSFDILKAKPGLTWVPGSLGSGTPLGPSQLNASASGLGGSPLSGTFTYTPSAGTSFEAGTATLTVQFIPSSSNYSAESMSVTIPVSGSMKFAGFYAPIRNLPYVNTVQAGRAIPVKFTVGSYRGMQVLQMNPTSVAVSCPAGALENVVKPSVTGTAGLKSLGYSYTYTWKTSKDWAGSCRTFVLTLADGSSHEALFRFTAAPKVTAKRILGR